METAWHGSLKSYIVGFILCIILTLGAYFLVEYDLLLRKPLLYTLIGLAVTQVTIQVICFLHLGSEKKPHWNRTAFFFMLLVLFIIVLGSLWIMSELNYNVMPPMSH